MIGWNNEPGVMYKMIEDIFTKVSRDTTNNFEIKVSYVEIYNE